MNVAVKILNTESASVGGGGRNLTIRGAGKQNIWGFNSRPDLLVST